jgi:hypothetical protein
MIKKLVLAILLAYSTAVSAQNVNPDTGSVSTTGNLIDPNAWTGVIYMTPAQLAQVEGTGGGPIPAFNTGTNTIRYSFMPYTASQIQAINAAMFNNNTNIQVSGYNYSWRLFGDNGFLNVTGKLYDTKGAVLEQASYDYFFSPAMPKNWELISGTSNFSTAHKFDTLGSLEFSATGSDSLFWSGYYGPRIRDINISFNYSLIPTPAPTLPTSTTSNNVISDAIAQATEPVVTEPVTTTSTASTSSSTPVAESTAPTAQSTTSSSLVTTVAAISPTISPSATTSTNTSSSSNQSSNSASAPSLSSIMSMIESNQARENNIAMTAVAQSNEVAQTAAAQAEKTALETASNSLSQSLDVAKDSAKSETKDNKTNTNSSLALLPSSGPFVFQANSNVVQQSQQLANQFNLPVNPYNSQQQQQQSQLMNNNNLNASSGLFNRPEVVIPLPPVVQEIAQPLEMKVPTVNNIAIQQVDTPNNSMSLFAKRGDPLTDYIEQNNILVAMAQPETKSTTVKTNVQDNDLAGIVRIERMAVTPVGFSVYSLALRDVAFYQPKEIYKNVVIKDNVRTMYFIEKGNTDTYNKMIEGQYK